MLAAGSTDEAVLAPGKYFILNDNRNLYSDSRLWGPGDQEEIIAKVILSYWPHFSLH